MFLISSIAIAAFYGAGLMWGQQTHLAVAEYWRWWVVHLWVEGFFEVFATVAIAFLFVRMQLINAKVATSSVLFSTIVITSYSIHYTKLYDNAVAITLPIGEEADFKGVVDLVKNQAIVWHEPLFPVIRAIEANIPAITMKRITDSIPVIEIP